MSHPKVATVDHEIHDLIRSRWSPRAFDAARDVPRDALLRLLEAARWSPSSGNEQPWAFLIATRGAGAHGALLGTLTDRNQAWAAAAPLLALVAVRVALERAESASPSAWYDAGQAVAYLTLQATAQGLSIRQMEGFDRARAREACGVPAEFQPAVVMAIGYAGDPDAGGGVRPTDPEGPPRGRGARDAVA